MLMTNEYGSAFKRAHSPEEIEELMASGWRAAEVKQTAAEPLHKATEESPAMEARRIVRGGKNELMYKGQYLSQWAGNASKKELVQIFDYFGIAYSTKTSKNDMQKALRQSIREVKAEQRREKHDGT